MNQHLNDDHPVFEACRIGDFETVKRYLDAGVSVYAESETNPAIFGIAASRGHKDILELMIQRGLDITTPHNKFGSSVAEFAVRKDSVEQLDYFMKLGVPIGHLTNHGNSLLALCASGGKLLCMKYLLNQGAEIDVSSPTGGTPLFEAARNNQVKAIELLYGAGADIEAKDSSRHTPLIIAAKAGKLEAVEWLVEHGVQ